MQQDAARLPASRTGKPSHRSSRRNVRPNVGVAGVLAVCLAMLLAACGSDAPPSDVTEVPPPPSTEAEVAAPSSEVAPRQPTVAIAPLPPTTAELLLGRATQLEHDGFWEDAADARRRALSDASADDLRLATAGEALLAQMRLLLRLNQPTNALLTLAQLDQQPDIVGAVPGGPLSLLRGRVLSANGNTVAALGAYDAYLESDGPARHVALLSRARLQTVIGDADSAFADYTAIRADPTTSPLDLESALLEGGLLLENEARYGEANEWYERLGAISPWLSDDVFALHRSGAVRLAQQDVPGAVEAWTTLLVEYPGHWRAVEAYDGLLSLGLLPDPLTEALFFYRQFRLDDAIAVYSRVLAANPPAHDAGIATYYLAAIDESLGRSTAAVDGYLAAASVDPVGPQADDALWWAARLMEQGRAETRALATFERLATEHRDSPFATEAAFRVPLARYTAGDLQGAAADFGALAGALTGEEAQRAWLWLGKSLDASGDRIGAEAAFGAGIAAGPSTYAGLRAHADLSGALLSPRSVQRPILATSPLSAPPAESWLDALAAGEQEDAQRDLDDSAHWQAALELWAAGLTSAADARFRIALSHFENVWTVFRAGQIFDGLGAVHLRLAAGEALLDHVPSGDRAAAPAEVLQWAYPRGWPDLAETAARNFRVDELLLYALIRQESRFNPAAGSVAGALGLTQVIPATGADIAQALDDRAFETALLFRPERSIRYGAAYLGAQLTNFDQATWIALAAYNGGPGSAAGWSNGAAAVDPDLFYERITFQETRDYLRLVLENYAWYQYIYRGSDVPTIVSVDS